MYVCVCVCVCGTIIALIAPFLHLHHEYYLAVAAAAVTAIRTINEEERNKITTLIDGGGR